ncbi:MAG: hypothetical protein H7837_11105 [Magnetococcus sp. MYC-9]
MNDLPLGLPLQRRDRRRTGVGRMLSLCLLGWACWSGALPGQASAAEPPAAAKPAEAKPAAAKPAETKPAEAKPAEAKPAAAKPAEAKPPTAGKEKGKEPDVSDKAVGIGDPAQLLNSLEQRRLELERRAKWLDLREADLKRLEEKLAKRIGALESLRGEIRASLEKEKVVDDANVARLAKILSGMKVKAAADGLKSMDRETAVLVLKVMKEKVAAKILSKMDNEQAAQLANELGIPMADKKTH